MAEADYPGQIARRRGALIEYLEPELARRKSTLDHAQAAALDRLQQLADELTAFRSARKSALRRLFAPPDVPRGVYLGRRRPRKNVPDGQLLRERQNTAQNARPFPRVHARRARGAGNAQPRYRSADGRRRTDRR